MNKPTTTKEEEYLALSFLLPNGVWKVRGGILKGLSATVEGVVDILGGDSSHLKVIIF